MIDWNLPDLPGIEIVRRMRGARIDVPVVMVTARDSVDDRIVGLDAGADDYVVKPFFVDELLARIRSVVRRRGTQSTARFVEGKLVVDTQARAASYDGVPVTLSAREFMLLEFLVRNAGIALAREDIEEHVWGDAFERSSNVLDVMVGRVRRKVGGKDSHIETVRGVGYRFARNGTR